MARPEEGYPSATETVPSPCIGCDGWGRRLVFGFQAGGSYTTEHTCHICRGQGTVPTPAYQWYEPIKILPPRTRRRPDPVAKFQTDTWYRVF